MDDTTQEPETEAFDPTRRKLCPDGACVGVIGDDGRCRVCGRTEAESEAGQPIVAPAGRDDVSTDDVPAFDESAAEHGVDTSAAEHGVDASAAFDSKRRLCDDGSCVGVVGEDGVCPVCGRRSE